MGNQPQNLQKLQPQRFAVTEKRFNSVTDPQ